MQEFKFASIYSRYYDGPCDIIITDAKDAMSHFEAMNLLVCRGMDGVDYWEEALVRSPHLRDIHYVELNKAMSRLRAIKLSKEYSWVIV